MGVMRDLYDFAMGRKALATAAGTEPGKKPKTLEVLAAGPGFRSDDSGMDYMRKQAEEAAERERKKKKKQQEEAAQK